MSKLLLMLSKEKTNLMPLILLFIQYSFNAQHVSAINTTIFRSLRLIGCYFMGCIWFGVCWRSVSVWLWRCGVFMQSEARKIYLWVSFSFCVEVKWRTVNDFCFFCYR